jgi:hypothetical protein
LNRNMATTDVDSILSGLDSEDEAAFVVWETDCAFIFPIFI